MKKLFSEIIDIPAGISCDLNNEEIVCKNSEMSLSKKLPLTRIQASIKDEKITLKVRGNKNEWKLVKSYVAHIKNLFLGLSNKFVYSLEVCNVHFPMTLKVEKNKIIINNFLGERVPRSAEILPNVSIEVKGPKITLSSNNKESAGQTAANIERATRIKYRDRRIFQDGIYITSKPGDES